MKILALDLGTTTGIAHNLDGSPVTDRLQLATSKEITAWGEARLTRRCDPRVIRLFRYLENIAILKPDLVVFEDVTFSTTTYQTQLWASFRTTLWLWVALHPGPIIDCVPVTTLKKFATGHGGATKPMMLSALRKNTMWGVLAGHMDDNQVDAAWIFNWANTHIKL